MAYCGTERGVNYAVMHHRRSPREQNAPGWVVGGATTCPSIHVAVRVLKVRTDSFRVLATDCRSVARLAPVSAQPMDERHAEPSANRARSAIGESTANTGRPTVANRCHPAQCAVRKRSNKLCGVSGECSWVACIRQADLALSRLSGAHSACSVSVSRPRVHVARAIPHTIN